MADTPDYSELPSSSSQFTMDKVSKLASPGTYTQTSNSGILFSTPTQLGQSATTAAQANMPSIANGLGSATIGYNNTTVDMKTIIDGKDVLQDVRATCWQPNVISGVEQPAYHIRFYMVEDVPLPLSSYKNYADYYKALQALHQTTIAESGVTGLNITGLTIETMAAPNPATRSMAATSITLSIVEPMGVSFFDMIADAAAELAISNFSKLYYYIDVKFIGYDPGGATNMNVCKDFDNGGIWTYQVRVNDVAVDSNSAASSYTFTVAPFNEHIFSSDDLKLPTTFMPSGSTVGGILNELAEQLNTYNSLLYAYNTRVYSFRTTPCSIKGQTMDPSKWTVVPDDIEFNYERAMAMGSIEGIDQQTPIKGTFPAGANINDVIETIIVNSKDAQRMAKDVAAQDKTTKDDKKPRDCLIFRYEPTIEITGFDPITSQYIESVTFDILSYYTGQPVIEQDDVTNAQDTNNQVEQAQKITSAGYMCKRYDYMFTGLNTEVLNFDFKYNFSFEIALPKLAGYQNSHSSYADHARVRDDAKDIRAIQERNKTLADNLKKAQDNLAKLKQQRDSINTAIAAQNGKATSAQTTALAENAAQQKSWTDSEASSAASAKSIQKSVSSLMQSGNLSTNLVSRLPTTRTQIKYAEDLLQDKDINRFPISTNQTGNDPRHSVSGKIPESYTRDRAIYGAILDQLYAPLAQSLQQITLSIKGDPYWLGTGNIERAIARAQDAANGTVRDHLAPNTVSRKQVDYAWGDILFLLTFKYPLSVGDDGSPVLKTNESFTGIYRVISIKHTFHDGQFTQEITAVRCQLMDAFKALGVKVVDIPTTSSAADFQTVSAQAATATATPASTSTPTSTTNSSPTTSSSTIAPPPSAPAYSPLQPPLPPSMSGTKT